MTEYSVTFFNQTKCTQKNVPAVVTFCIYRTEPKLPGLESVAWKNGSAVPGGKTEIKWITTHNVTMSNYHDETGNGVYNNSQTIDTKFKDKFQVINDEVSKELIYSYYLIMNIYCINCIGN